MVTNVKISELPAKTEVKEATDLIIVQDGNVTNVMTAGNFMANKVNKTALKDVAFTGSWNDITDKPEIVTKDVATLTNFYNITTMDALLGSKVDTSVFNVLEQKVLGKADQATTLAGYSIGDAYTQTECDNKFAEKGTTLADYTIGDAYTKTEADGKVATAKSETITYVDNNYVKKEYVDTNFALKTTVQALDTALASTQGSVNSLVVSVSDLQANKFNTPSVKTIAGFGITDAYTKTETDAQIASAISTVYKYKGSVNNYSDLPTSGQAVGDVWNIVNADETHGIDAGDNVAWTGTVWDVLGGFVNLDNCVKKTESLWGTSLQTALDEKAKSTDVYTITETNTLLDNKANKATTLNGYGITDAYTQTELNNLFNAKLNKAEFISYLTTALKNGVTVGTSYNGMTLKVVDGALKLVTA